MANEYPMMVYKGGTEIEWDGLMLDTRIVADADEAADAFADGWLAAADVTALHADEAADAPAPRGRKPKAG